MTPALKSSAIAIAESPEWLAAEMPPGYQNRLAEIRRLSDELQAMDRFGRLLWQAGEPLAGALSDALAAMGLDPELVASLPVPCVRVKLDAHRRLLLQAASATKTLKKNDPELAQLFRLVQEVAEETDRVALVANGDPQIPPADRPETVGAEALALVNRLGVNVLSGSVMFSIWSISQQEKERARGCLDRLHAQDGGAFTIPASARL